MAESETTSVDAFLGGRLHLEQPVRGYRAGADAVLLAAAVGEGAMLMEAGCGVGAALLGVALRFPAAMLTGVERDPAAVALARANAARNGLSARVRVEEGDALEAQGVFDGVFCNPPFLEPGRGTAPEPVRHNAHLADAPLDRWISALSNRLRGGAALTLIHRADRLADILAALEGRLGAVSVFPVRPQRDRPAHRVLVRAIKGSRAPLSLLPGLDLHDDSGAKFTTAADTIFRGDAAIAW